MMPLRGSCGERRRRRQGVGGEQRVTMETGEAEAGLGLSEWAGGGGKR